MNWADPARDTAEPPASGAANIEMKAAPIAEGAETSSSPFRQTGNPAGVLRPGWASHRARCLSLAVSGFAASILLAGASTHLGREFWLAFPGNFPDPLNAPQLTISIVGTPGTTGLVEVATPPWRLAFSIPMNTSNITLSLPGQADLGQSSDVVQTNAVRVLASQPVGVFGLHHLASSTDGFLGLPVDLLGTNYYVLGYGNTLSGSPELNGSQFAIAATQDNTLVAITPTVTIGARLAGVPYQLALSRGQTYQLRYTGNSPGDLSGTAIRSDKPIAVFAGHRCATIPDATAFFCNYLVEQLPPTDAWGTRYLVQPLAWPGSGQRVRFVAQRANTVVSVAAETVESQIVTLGAGQVFERVLSEPLRITATDPVLVAQFTPSASPVPPGQPDATMTLVPAVDRFFTQTFLAVSNAGMTDHFLDLVVSGPLSPPPVVLLDGQTMSLVPVFGGEFYTSRLRIGGGGHAITSSAPASVIVYGYATADAYAYPGGFAATRPGADEVVFSSPTRVVAHCQNGQGVPVTFQVGARSACAETLPVTCSPASGSLFPTGDTIVRCTATNCSGQSVSHSFVVTVGCLTIERQVSDWIVRWTGTATLQESDSLQSNNWRDVITVGNQQSVPNGISRRFYRIKY